MTLEELDIIKEHIFADADNRYVHIEDCNEKQENINNKLANDDKRIDLLIAKFNVLEKLLWAIASASIGALVTSILELIMK